MLFIDAAHERSCGRQHLVHEDEDGLLGRKLDTLADHVNELPDGEVCWYEVLLLIDGSDVRLFDLLTDHLFIAARLAIQLEQAVYEGPEETAEIFPHPRGRDAQGK